MQNMGIRHYAFAKGGLIPICLHGFMFSPSRGGDGEAGKTVGVVLESKGGKTWIMKETQWKSYIRIYL